MLAYSQAVWRYRHFWMSLVRMEVRTKFGTPLMGLCWALVRPVAVACVMCLVFGRLFGMSAREYMPSLIAGMVIWQYVTACLGGGNMSLIQAEPYIRQFPAPMAIYPLRTMLVAAYHLLFGMALLLVVNAAVNGFDPVSLVVLPPALLLFLAFGWAGTVLAAFARVYFAGSRELVGLALQMGFYTMPILVPRQVIEKRGVGWMIDYNPFAALIEIVRTPLLGRGMPDLTTYLMAVGFAVAVVGAAVLTLNRLERTVIFRL